MAASIPQFGSTIDPVRVSSQQLVALAHAGESLPLQAMRARAAQSGLYLSAFRGRGMEFDEARPYQPGDDVRTLDWKVTARTGRAHTKQFREERERPVLLWLDLRRPMFFATRGCFKAVIASHAAALLGWSASAHRDRLGGLIFSETDHKELKPQRGKTGVLRFIQTLCRHPAWQATQKSDDAIPLSNSMLRLMNVAHPGSLIFLLSDFRGFDQRTEQHLGQIARHNDVVMIHISDPLEAELPPPGHYRFSDDNNTRTLNTEDQPTREQYQQRFQQHAQALQHYCKKHRVFYLPLLTNDNIVNRLQTGLGLKKYK
ncbi:MAG: DUF58 domain-containing protein [Gammaproteobacteria bacterium]|nr:DUF58 domain-containing protein [Gammaproteobacteria bacterium]